MVGGGLSMTFHNKGVVLVGLSNAICGSFDERQVLLLLAPNLKDYEIVTADLDVLRNNGLASHSYECPLSKASPPWSNSGMLTSK